MQNREATIITAAFRLILRYGVARTTMHDIAKEAGTSRQTLYATFPNKEELLRATIRYLADETVREITAGCAAAETLADQLDVVFNCIAVKHFDLLHASPDADDIISGFDAACKDELAEAATRYRELIERILDSHRVTITAAGLTVAQLADLIQRSTITLKHEATSRAHLLRLIEALKVLVLNLLKQAA